MERPHNQKKMTSFSEINHDSFRRRYKSELRPHAMPRIINRSTVVVVLFCDRFFTYGLFCDGLPGYRTQATVRYVKGLPKVRTKKEQRGDILEGHCIR
jgi:hypothetical protein